MCPAHRLEVLAQIKRRLNAGQDCRVISTQVVECGGDLYFPIVYSPLCGLDSLAAAAGRCNRKGKLAQPGEVIFFDPEERRSALRSGDWKSFRLFSNAASK